jgi:hypothetical protein
MASLSDDPLDRLAWALVVQTMPLNEDLFAILLGWPLIAKSPYGASFYDTPDKRWDHTPLGSRRISDHWDFKNTSPGRNCPSRMPRTGHKVGARWACGTWDGEAYVIAYADPFVHSKTVSRDGQTLLRRHQRILERLAGEEITLIGFRKP